MLSWRSARPAREVDADVGTRTPNTHFFAATGTLATEAPAQPFASSGAGEHRQPGGLNAACTPTSVKRQLDATDAMETSASDSVTIPPRRLPPPKETTTRVAFAAEVRAAVGAESAPTFPSSDGRAAAHVAHAPTLPSSDATAETAAATRIQSHRRGQLQRRKTGLFGMQQIKSWSTVQEVIVESQKNEAQRATFGAQMGLSRRREALLALYLTVALYIVAYASTTAVLPFYIRSMGGSTGEVGVIISLQALLAGGGTYFMGSLSDRYGRRPMLGVALAGSIIGLLLGGLAPASPDPIVTIALGRCVTGTFSVVDSLGLSYVSDLVHQRERSKAFGIFGLLTASGFLVGVPFGSFLTGVSMTAPFWVASGVMATSLTISIWLHPSPAELMAMRATMFRRVRRPQQGEAMSAAAALLMAGQPQSAKPLSLSKEKSVVGALYSASEAQRVLSDTSRTNAQRWGPRGSRASLTRLSAAEAEEELGEQLGERGDGTADARSDPWLKQKIIASVVVAAFFSALSGATILTVLPPLLEQTFGMWIDVRPRHEPLAHRGHRPLTAPAVLARAHSCPPPRAHVTPRMCACALSRSRPTAPHGAYNSQKFFGLILTAAILSGMLCQMLMYNTLLDALGPYKLGGLAAAFQATGMLVLAFAGSAFAPRGRPEALVVCFGMLGQFVGSRHLWAIMPLAISSQSTPGSGDAGFLLSLPKLTDSVGHVIGPLLWGMLSHVHVELPFLAAGMLLWGSVGLFIVAAELSGTLRSDPERARLLPSKQQADEAALKKAHAVEVEEAMEQLMYELTRELQRKGYNLADEVVRGRILDNILTALPDEDGARRVDYEDEAAGEGDEHGGAVPTVGLSSGMGHAPSWSVHGNSRTVDEE